MSETKESPGTDIGTELRELSGIHMRPLLDLNDKLRKLAQAENDIHVTSIVCVGDQSHGKSSVIEALSGVNLPRGTGIVTRVPLVLVLRNLCGSGYDEECAFIKAEGVEAKEVALADVAKEVLRVTAVLTEGRAKDVVDKEIELTVFRESQDDLTLIDLPGMTRVPVEGQHADIEATITSMYTRYMEPQEAVVLNVVSAMVDCSTSKSLQMSTQMDPACRRSLLCITKADQHGEPGLLAKIQGASGGLGLPAENVFCVVNRSQAENEQGLPLARAREQEREYFNTHSELRRLPASKRGMGPPVSGAWARQ